MPQTLEVSIVTHDDRDGDCETYWYFNRSEALRKAENLLAHLTDREKKHREIFVSTHPIEIPSDYEPTTGEQLLTDLSDGSIESPDFDTCIYTASSIHTFYLQIL